MKYTASSGRIQDGTACGRDFRTGWPTSREIIHDRVACREYSGRDGAPPSAIRKRTSALAARAPYHSTPPNRKGRGEHLPRPSRDLLRSALLLRLTITVGLPVRGPALALALASAAGFLVLRGILGELHAHGSQHGFGFSVQRRLGLFQGIQRAIQYGQIRIVLAELTVEGFDQRVISRNRLAVAQIQIRVN